MVKDYARKPYRTHLGTGARVRSHTPKSKLPLVCGLLFVLLASSLTAWWYWPSKAAPQPVAPAPETLSTTKARGLLDEFDKIAASENRFDFYTILPNMAVDIPDVAAPPGTQHQSTIKPAQQPSAYIVQAGSFQTMAEADSLKARLALQGFVTQIQVVNLHNNQTWYRVYLGPFDSEDLASAAQVQLGANEVPDSFVLKIHI